MLTASERRQFLEYLPRWREASASTGKEILEDVSQRLFALYHDLGFSKPQIILCKGPTQQILFPALVKLMMTQGRDKSTESNFIRPAAYEPPPLALEWRSIWNDAFKAIDWSTAPAIDFAKETLLNAQIDHQMDRQLKHRLSSYADQELGFEQHLELEELCKSEVQFPQNQIRSSLSFEPDEVSYIWKSFLARLPQDSRKYFHKTKRKKTDVQPALNEPDLGKWMGSFDWYWLATSDYARKQSSVVMPTEAAKQLDNYMDLATYATSYLFCEHICFVYLKPQEAFFDQSWRRHQESKAAVQFVDGTRFYFWHGIEVDEQIILHPEKIKIKTIDQERNIEVRRIMIERYGIDNFTMLAKKVHEDDSGVLYVKEMAHDEPFAVVKVINSTPEPDGTFKTYFLRVPPETKTAREGVAWTFGLSEEDYLPLEET